MSATNRGSKREAQDLYETPEWCVDLILDRIKLDLVRTSLEPCRASGRIYNKLPGVRSYCEISEGEDYLEFQFTDIDLVVTNPPFSLAIEFLTKSLLESKTVVYLLRIPFLASSKRAEFFNENRLTHLYVLARRPSFKENGLTDMTEYAWFVWDRGNLLLDDPGIYVLESPGTVNLGLFE